MKAKLMTIRKTKQEPVFDLENQILKFGLNSEPTSANVVAKRLEMKETPRNIAMIREVLEKLEREKKVYRCGSRYAIDFQGGFKLMKSFCIKISDENYKINNYIFEPIANVK